MNIEQIMEPYFSEKEKFEKKYIQEKNALKLRLQRLRENKDAEIKEYVNNALNSNQNFYVGYGAMLRKDLEQSYAEKEAQLEKEINNFDKYYRVDVRQLADIKQELRKDLFSAKKNLEIRLQEVELNYNVIMLNLSKFKLEYDEQHRVLNGDAYKSIYAQADSLIDVKRSIQKELEAIGKYISETELSKEEISALMMSMTPWEKEEYDRRKATKVSYDDLKPVEEEPISTVEEESISTVEEEPISTVEQVQEITQEDVVETLEDSTYEDDNVETELDQEPNEENLVQAIPENNEVVLSDALDDLLSEIFTDILQNSKEFSVVKNEKTEKNDEAIELDGKFYCNLEDITKATKDYYKKNKGNKYKVNGIEENLSMTRKGLRRLKKAVKNCSTIILLKDKKLSSFDIKRVYGKDKADEYDNEIKEIGTIETKSKEGYYINAEQYKNSLKCLFGVKRDSWLERLTSNLRKINNPEYSVESIDEFEENKVKLR